MKKVFLVFLRCSCNNFFMMEGIYKDIFRSFFYSNQDESGADEKKCCFKNLVVASKLQSAGYRSYKRQLFCFGQKLAQS